MGVKWRFGCLRKLASLFVVVVYYHLWECTSEERTNCMSLTFRKEEIRHNFSSSLVSDELFPFLQEF